MDDALSASRTSAATGWEEPWKLLDDVLAWSGARPATTGYHALKYADAVERAEAAIARRRLAGEQATGGAGPERGVWKTTAIRKGEPDLVQWRAWSKERGEVGMFTTEAEAWSVLAPRPPRPGSVRSRCRGTDGGGVGPARGAGEGGDPWPLANVWC